MPVIAWGPDLEVGFGDIDAQHRRLVGILNATAEAVGSGADRTRIGEVLDELVRYTMVHFRFEEQLMAKYGLDAEDHAGHHARLTGQVQDYVARFESGEAVEGELLGFLSDWLRFHIGQEDRALARDLLAAGAESGA